MQLSEFQSGDFLAVTDQHVGVTTLLPPGYVEVARSAHGCLAMRPGRMAASRVDQERGCALILIGSLVDDLTAVADRLSQQFAGDSRTVTERVIAVAATLQGHFAVAVLHPFGVVVITDHMGGVPVYVTGRPQAGISGTNLGGLASLFRAKLDPESVDEFLSTGRVTSPFTLYTSIHRQWPATACSPGTTEGEPFWQPPAPENIDLKDAGAQLCGLLLKSIERLAQWNDRVSVLYSGGDDSRIVARAAVAVGLAPQCIIFSDHENRELKKARLAAKLSGVELTVRNRSSEQNASEIRDMVLQVGPGIDLLHAHSVALVHSLEDAVPVLDGYFAGLAKADYAMATVRRRRGVPISLAQLPSGWTSRSELTSAGNRGSEKLARLGHLEEPSVAEWARQYPVSDQDAYPFMAFNQRHFPSLSPLLLHPLLDAAGRVPIELRLNRRLYRAAFRPLLGTAAFVPRSDGEVLGLPARLDVFVTAVNRTSYRLSDRLLKRRNQGPWQSSSIQAASADNVLSAFQRDTLERVAYLSADSELLRSDGGRPWKVTHRLSQMAALIESQPWSV